MTGPRLYHVGVPGLVQSRAFRCLWLLEELDVDDFEVCMLTPGQPYGAQMRAYGVLHSTKLPTFQIDGRELNDSGVISQVIAEKYASHRTLLGTTDERIDLLQWIGFAETCITFRIPLLPALMNRDKSLAELQTEAIEPMRAVFTDNVARFEAHFEAQESDYLLPSGFSMTPWPGLNQAILTAAEDRYFKPHF